jgi:hypothetical protein
VAQFDEAISEEPQAPASVPLRRLATGQGHQLRFQMPVQFPRLHIRRGPRTEGGVHPFFDAPLAHPHHGAEADVQRLADCGIGPRRAAFRLVSLQQNACVGENAGGGFAFRDKSGQSLSLLDGECNAILLGHGEHLHTQ